MSQQFFHIKEPLALDCGTSLDDIHIAYETFGTLNDECNNAILICHALTGSSHVTSHSDTDDPGWWESIVGPGKAVDTSVFFVICSTVLGSCKGSTGPSTINPATQLPYGLSFPVITIADMVRCQHALIESLNISQLHAVIGPSMGGMQATQWAISYPKKVKKCMIIASSPSLSPQALAFGTVGRNAITSDPMFNHGKYGDTKPKTGLSIARMIGHITYLSQESITQKFGRRLQEKEEYGFHLAGDFQIESYLQHQGDKFVDHFDANSYLYLSKALSYFDLEKQYGSLKKAFKPVEASLLFISISSDWLYPTHQSKQMVKACMNLNKHVSFCEVQSGYGHDSFLIEHKPFGNMIMSFLGNIS